MNRLSILWQEFISKPADPVMLSIFRILYGLICTSTAIQCYQYIPFNYSTPETISLMTGIWTIWLVSSILVLLGVGGKIPLFLSTLAVTPFFGTSVGSDQLRIMGFWLMFMGATRVPALTLTSRIPILHKLNAYSPQARFWPVYMMGCNIAFNVTTAGISKAFDPFWTNGLGFYYTLIQPWLKYPVFNFMLNSEWLMHLMSYGTIISESLAFLIVFRFTRTLGILNLFAMYSLLTFIIRIDIIGPTGLLITFGICSISPQMLSFFKKIKHRMFPTLSFKVDTRTSPIEEKWNSFFSIITTTILIVFILVNALLSMGISDGKLFKLKKYPIVHYPFSQTPPSPPLIKEQTQSKKHALLKKMLMVRNNYSLGGWYAPFCFKHFIFRGYYKIVPISSETISLPRSYHTFNDDGTTNFWGKSGGIMKPRILQNSMYKLTLLYHRFTYWGSISPENIETIRRYMDYYYNRLPENERHKVSALELQIRLIHVPKKFEGDVKPWLDHPFLTFATYNPTTDTVSFNNNLEKLEFDHKEYWPIKDYPIYFNP